MRDDERGGSSSEPSQPAGPSGSDDTEKRWHDPAALRAAIYYVLAVVAGSCLAAAVAAAWHVGTGWALVTPIALFAGGLGAFYRTWRVWRVGGTWPIWHGAGWALLTLAVFALSVVGGILVGGS